MESVNNLPPFLGQTYPNYPVHVEALRVTGGTVPGPSGYASSSVLGPSLYVAFVQQLNPTTLLPRDRAPCLALDLNRTGLVPGYYTNCRLAGSYQSLPLYEVGTSGASPLGALVNTLSSGASGAGQSNPNPSPSQIIQLQYLSPTQLAILNNLTPCQLQTLLNNTQISDIITLTNTLTATQLQNLISYSTTTQFNNLRTALTTSQIIALTTALNQDQVYSLVSVLTPAQIRTLITGLTSTQLQTLATLTPNDILTLVTGFTTAQIASLLNSTPLADLLATLATTPPTPTTGGVLWIDNTGALKLTTSAGTSTVSTGGSTLADITAAGSTQGDAAALTGDVNHVTGADGTKGVVLSSTLLRQDVWNDSGASNLKIYPPSGGTIAGLGLNAALSVSATQVRGFVKCSSNKWSYYTGTGLS